MFHRKLDVYTCINSVNTCFSVMGSYNFSFFLMKFAGVKGIIDRSGQQLKVREAQFSATLHCAKRYKFGPLGQSGWLCSTWKRPGDAADVQ